MRRHCQFTVKRSPKCAVSDQPQRPPSQHDSTTVWHLGHSRCARTKIGASVVSQYGQRGGSALAGLSSVALSVGTFYHWQCYPDFLEVIFDIFLFSRPAKKKATQRQRPSLVCFTFWEIIHPCSEGHATQSE